MALNPRQERFVAEYLEDLNATQAAIRAGYSEKTAGTQSFDLLQKPEIQSAIYDGRQAMAERTGVTVDRIVAELAIVAFGTLDEVAPWTEDGPNLIPSADLTRDQRAQIASIKVKRERPWRGKGEEAEQWQVEHVEIKREDKMKAIELLGKRLGMFTDKVELSGPAGGAIPVQFQGLSTDELRKLARGDANPNA